MDEFIKKGKNATHNDFPCMIMYYPGVTKKQTLWKTFLSKIFDLF